MKTTLTNQEFKELTQNGFEYDSEEGVYSLASDDGSIEVSFSYNENSDVLNVVIENYSNIDEDLCYELTEQQEALVEEKIKDCYNNYLQNVA